MVIVIITIAFIVKTTIVAVSKRKNACLQTTLERLIFMFKANNKYTKNNMRALPGVEGNLFIG